MTVDFMTTSYVLNIKLSDKFNKKMFFSRLAIFSKWFRPVIAHFHFEDWNRIAKIDLFSNFLHKLEYTAGHS